MIELLALLCPWAKALHVVSLIAWMAGMLYLLRLFVYHCDGRTGSVENERFKLMERRLLKYLINPAMIATWTVGALLALTPGAIDWSTSWWRVKLACVVLMSAFHGEFSRRRRAFARDQNTRLQRFYRLANEVPAGLAVIVVIMVIVKPF